MLNTKSTLTLIHKIIGATKALFSPAKAVEVNPGPRQPLAPSQCDIAMTYSVQEHGGRWHVVYRVPGTTNTWSSIGDGRTKESVQPIADSLNRKAKKSSANHAGLDEFSQRTRMVCAFYESA